MNKTQLSIAALKVADLTPRQTETLVHIAEGRTHLDIADRMKIGMKTVSYHVDRVHRKLNCNSIALLARIAERAGLV